jgi:hypothetical protein
MKNISKEDLVKVLKLLYKLWNRQYEDKFPSNFRLEWGEGEPYNFYMTNRKYLGLGGEYDDFYFWMNALEENEDNLDNDTLDVSNVTYPAYNTFTIRTQEERVEDVTIYYEGSVEGYMTENQLQYSFYELGSGEMFEYYDFDEVDRDYGDSRDSNGIELVSINLDSREVQESKFDKFINSLTESELKFFQEKINQRLL